MITTGQNELTAARVAKGSIYLTFQNVFSTFIAVFGFAFMARMVTTDEMGVIAGLTLLASLAPLISEFGLDSSILKHVSELKGKEEKISGVVATAVVFRTVLCIIIASVIFFVSPILSEIFFKTSIYTYVIQLLSIDVILLSITPLLNNILLGVGKLKERAIFGLISIVIRWTSIIFFLLSSSGLEGIVAGWIIGDALLLLFLTVAVKKFTGLNTQAVHGVKQQIFPMLKFAFPLYLSSFVIFIFKWYDKAIVLAYLPLSDLGLYNTAYTAFSVLALLSTAMGSALTPYYGMAYGKNDHQAIRLCITRASKYMMLVVFPLTMGLMALATPVLTLFAGPQYEAGGTSLAILSFFGLTYALTPILSIILLIYGKTKEILLISLIPVVSSLLMLPLVWVAGLTGLALMKGASLAFTLVLTVFFMKKIVEIKLDKKVLFRSLVASIIMAVAMIIPQQFFRGQFALLLSVLVGGFIYITLIRIQKIFDHEDYELLGQIIGPKLATYFSRIMGYKQSPPKST